MNSHPGTAAHEFYADYIADLLEENYPKILGKKNGPKQYDIKLNAWLPRSLMTEKVKESETLSEYVIRYPDAGADHSLLRMPIKKDYIKLCFHYPVDITSVTITGQKLESATLYVTDFNDELGFDETAMRNLGQRNANACRWEDKEPRRVTSLCVHAEIAGGAGDRLTINIECAKGGARP